MRVCLYPPCEHSDKLIKGFCNKHYHRWKRGTLYKETPRTISQRQVSAKLTAPVGTPLHPQVEIGERVMGLPLTHANVPEILRRVAAQIKGKGK